MIPIWQLSCTGPWKGIEMVLWRNSSCLSYYNHLGGRLFRIICIAVLGSCLQFSWTRMLHWFLCSHSSKTWWLHHYWLISCLNSTCNTIVYEVFPCISPRHIISRNINIIYTRRYIRKRTTTYVNKICKRNYSLGSKSINNLFYFNVNKVNEFQSTRLKFPIQIKKDKINNKK